MKVLIVDDEKSCRSTLQKHLQKIDGNFEIMEARNGIEGIELVKSLEPFLVFLDIQMPKLSGFDVLCHFPERSFHVVFQTAYDEYAIRAFEENALDYLLKPISFERFQKCMARVEKLPRPPGTRELVNSLVKKGMTLENIAVGSSGNQIVSIKDVVYFKSENRMVRVFTDNFNYSCDFSLTALEHQLEENNFIRFHRNCLVNVKKIKKTRFEKRHAVFTMINDDEISVSREKTSLARQMFS